MRLFWAITLSDALRSGLAQHIAQLRAKHEAKWVKPEKLHVTVLFLGEKKPEELPALLAAARGALVRQRPFSLGLHGAGTFGKPASPRVLYFAMHGDQAAAQSVERALATALKVGTADGPYTPHITLARAKQPRGSRALSDVAQRLASVHADPFRVESLTLFHSRGDAYLPLGEVALGAPLFHLLAQQDWDAAKSAGAWKPPSLAAQGFVHLSDHEQVLGTANRFYAGRRDLVLLQLDAPRLPHEVRYEEGEPGVLFPHLYGPLPVTAVESATPIVPDARGVFSALPQPRKSAML